MAPVGQQLAPLFAQLPRLLLHVHAPLQHVAAHAVALELGAVPHAAPALARRARPVKPAEEPAVLGACEVQIAHGSVVFRPPLRHLGLGLSPANTFFQGIHSSERRFFCGCIHNTMHSSPRTPRARFDDVDPVTLEEVDPAHGVQLRGKMYDSRSMLELMRRGYAQVPHTKHPLTRNDIARIHLAAGVPPPAPRATAAQRQLQAAIKRMDDDLLAGRRLSDRDLHVLIHHTMGQAFPSHVRQRYSQGRFHPEDARAFQPHEWTHMDTEWQFDMIERLRATFERQGRVS